jgi:hypothetical protein
MQLVEIRSEFHSLIDKINDPGILEQFYNALNSSVDKSSGVWASLMDEQKQGVLDAYQESENNENLIPLTDILNRQPL